MSSKCHVHGEPGRRRCLRPGCKVEFAWRAEVCSPACERELEGYRRAWNAEAKRATKERRGA